MTDITCPLCGKSNPDDREECLYCHAPLKAGGFVAAPEEGDQEAPIFPLGEFPADAAGQPASSLENAIPDWLKETEAGFLAPEESQPEAASTSQVSDQIASLLNQPAAAAADRAPAIDDEWLAGLLAEAGLNAPPPEEVKEEKEQVPEEPKKVETPRTRRANPPAKEPDVTEAPLEKPDWLADLEAGSLSKLDEEPSWEDEEKRDKPSKAAGKKGAKKKRPAKKRPEPDEEKPKSKPSLAPAEMPGWLEALRPVEEVSPTGPVEDLSAAEVVTAGPLSGLRGVISAHPSALRARKPPTYSIKLRVTDEQRARVEMMEELLREEQKPKPLASKSAISSRYITRLVIALVLLLPVFWMIVTESQRTPTPQPGSIPAVIDFSQQLQTLPSGTTVLLAFDYEAGFSGELNLAVTTLLSQLMLRNDFLTFVTTTPTGSILAESALNASQAMMGDGFGTYSRYANLGFIPGGTMGLLGLATNPRTLLPYSLEGDNVWVTAPLNTISAISDFGVVIVMTSDPGTARAWIEQVGPLLRQENKPLLFITSAQAEPLIRPYYEAVPAQVQGLVAGLAGSIAYGRTAGSILQNGMWDAFSAAITISVLIIAGGALVSVVMKMVAVAKQSDDQERQ